MRDIDAIIQALVAAYPSLQATQLTVAHPGADDDGLWFFRHPDTSVEVQLESTTGMCPFLFESSANNSCLNASSVTAAVALVATGLGLVGTAA